MAVGELRGEGDQPTDCTVLLLAPTGTAAYNINGMTVHSALKLPIRQHSKQEKLHQLRLLYQALSIVIIDEISMVSAQDLYNIHRRLTEIKGTTQADTYFGGILLLAVGDFFQLPPVAQKPVYELPRSPLARLAGSLWTKLFYVHFLNTIMRQKEDIEFANMLNKIRESKHTESDIEVLTGRLIDKKDPEYPHDAVHIFPTNAAVDQHNIERLTAMNKPVITLIAKDIKPDNSPLPDTFSLPDQPSLTGGLCKTLQLCVGARVMIIKNVDVPDGLVNGTQGTVIDFWKPEMPKESVVTAVIIKCDDSQCGSQTRAKYPQIRRKYQGCVPIFRDEIVVNIGRYTKGCQVVRQQFPLRLSWACTVHKTQGMTLNCAAVNIEGRFNPGQCYVALSRVTSINGLFLSKFNKEKIKCSAETQKYYESMMSKQVNLFQNPVLQRPSNVIKIALLNVRSYPRHEKDVQLCKDLLSADVLCFSETWLKHQRMPQIPNMTSYRQDRLHKRAGGVLVCINNQFPVCSVIGSTNTNIDLLKLKLETNLCLVVVYCAPDASASQCLQSIRGAVKDIPPSCRVLLLGDFNKVQLKSRLFTSYTPMITTPTCRTGGGLDQVYSNYPDEVVTHIQPVYFSDHSAIFIGAKYYFL